MHCSRLSLLHWSPVVLVYISVIITDIQAKNVNPNCSNNCMVQVNGYFTVGNNVGPPQLMSNISYKDVTPGQHVTISCLLCQSKPAATLTWYLNGKLLTSTKNRKRIIFLCGEKLSVKVLNQNDVGSYTCVAKNALGTSNATTIIRVIENTATLPLAKIKVEGMMMENDVKIGSTINMTCAVALDSHLKWSWKIGHKILNSSKHYILKEYHSKDDAESMTKLTIENLTYQDTGTYECLAHDRLKSGNISLKMSSSINVVPCFQGHYCPFSNSRVIRCPYKTFSWSNNSTSIKDCTVCPTDNRNETMINLENLKGVQTATIFGENCPVVTVAESSTEISGKSLGAKIGIGISVLVISIIIIVVVICAAKIWRRRKQSNLFQPSTLINIEIPAVPVTNDVYVCDCHSSKSKTWVRHTLLKKLKTQNFTTISHDDFEAGLAIWDNIVNAVYGSRKTLFILSKDALKSFYARSELRQALAAKAKGRQVIYILYEKVDNLPVEISRKVYLDWTDEENRDQFWRKLYRVIEKTSNNENF